MSVYTITASATGRLDAVLGADSSLATTLQGFSRSQAAKFISQGHVCVNGKAAQRASARVTLGDIISVEIPVREQTREAFEQELSILFEDETLIVIDKPAALSVHPGAGNKNKTLLNALVHHYQSSAGRLPNIFSKDDSERVGIVHRLDKNTTGVMVVAKTLEAHQSLQKQFHDRTVERNYIALCLASPRSKTELGRADSGIIEGVLRRKSSDRKSFELTPETGRGKFSKTAWQVVERFPFGLLVRCKLATGRTHQIRVHMRAAGNAVAGDTVYGDVGHLPKALLLSVEKFGRQALHAQTLGFVHPLTKERQLFEAPIPPDMQELVTLFRSWTGTY